MYNFFNLFKGKRGFTLIEMIIALSIFTLTILVATNIYLLINNTQRRTLNAQKITDDVRALFEAMSQQVRLGQINYDFYVQNGIDLYPQAASPVDVLAVKNQLNELVFFRKNGTKVQFCEEQASGDCDLASGPGWQDVTPEGVAIENLQFIITPSADPFVETTSVQCTADSGKTGECATVYGYSCPTATVCSAPPCYCEYYTDGGNFQPKVRIIIKSKATAASLAAQPQIIMQTTVSSRVITGQVKNENY